MVGGLSDWLGVMMKAWQVSLVWMVVLWAVSGVVENAWADGPVDPPDTPLAGPGAVERGVDESGDVRRGAGPRRESIRRLMSTPVESRCHPVTGEDSPQPLRVRNGGEILPGGRGALALNLRGDQPGRKRGNDRGIGPGRRFRDGAGRGRIFDEWPAEEIEAVSEFVRKRFPELARLLRNLEESNPREFELRMQELMPRMVRLMNAVRDDAEIGELGVREEQLHMQIHRNVIAFADAQKEPARENRRERVEGLVAELFEVRQKRGELTVQRLEARLERLKKQMEKREADKERLIQDEVDRRLRLAERFPLEDGPGRDVPMFGPEKE
jgi:hypothetical protein